MTETLNGYDLQTLHPGNLSKHHCVGFSMERDFKTNPQINFDRPVVLKASDTEFIAASDPKGGLLLFDGHGGVKKIQPNAALKLGRGLDCDVKIDDAYASRDHFSIWPSKSRPGSFNVRDNSTYKNSKYEYVGRPDVHQEIEGSLGPFRISQLDKGEYTEFHLKDMDSLSVKGPNLPVFFRENKIKFYLDNQSRPCLEYDGKVEIIPTDQYGQAQIVLSVGASKMINTFRRSPIDQLKSGVILRIFNGNIALIEDKPSAIEISTINKKTDNDSLDKERSIFPSPDRLHAHPVNTQFNHPPTDEPIKRNRGKEIITGDVIWTMAGKDRLGNVIDVEVTPMETTLKTHKEQFSGGDYGIVKILPDGNSIVIVGDPVSASGQKAIEGIQVFLEDAYSRLGNSQNLTQAREAVLSALSDYHQDQTRFPWGQRGSFTLGIVTIDKDQVNQWLFGDAGWIIRQDGRVYPSKQDLGGEDPAKYLYPAGDRAPIQVGYDDPRDNRNWLHSSFPASEFTGRRILIMTDSGLKLSPEDVQTIFASQNPAKTAADKGSKRDHTIAVYTKL